MGQKIHHCLSTKDTRVDACWEIGVTIQSTFAFTWNTDILGHVIQLSDGHFSACKCRVGKSICTDKNQSGNRKIHFGRKIQLRSKLTRQHKLNKDDDSFLNIDERERKRERAPVSSYRRTQRRRDEISSIILLQVEVMPLDRRWAGRPRIRTYVYHGLHRHTYGTYHTCRNP